MSYITKCWVPNCHSSKAQNVNLNFFPLPKELKYKEIWLALTGMKVTIPETQVYFCEKHFRESAIDKLNGIVIGLNPVTLPYYEMPAMVCRTCRAIIPQSGFFCVVSGIIPSSVPPEIEAEFGACRPEPLYQLLTFCIPNLSLEQNPPSLVCINCYLGIWLYFMFKVKCNTTENAVRDQLSPSQYGKFLLCRSCPEMHGTKFFKLNDNEPMGQIFKNMFITDYPTNVVPLQLCLKCYNVMQRLVKFHDQCVLSDQMVRRCTLLNNAKTCGDAPDILNLALKGEKRELTAAPSQSVYSGSLNCDGSPKFGETNNRRSEMAAPSQDWQFGESSERRNTGPTVKNPDIDPDMPVLVPCVEVESESKPITTSGKRARINLTQESKIELAKLMLKYRDFANSSTDHVESAKRGLEMWFNVVKDLHNAGHGYTLECIQNVWYRMKKAVRSLPTIIGPMTYLDYLITCYLTGVSVKTELSAHDGATSNNSLTETHGIINLCNMTVKNEMSGHREPMLNGGLGQHNNGVIVAPVNLRRNIKRSSELTGCDVICIDDDEEEQNACGSVTVADNNVGILENCDIKNKRKVRAVKTETTPAALATSSDKPTTSKPAKIPRKPLKTTPADSPLKGKRKKRKRRCRQESWTVYQKLQLAREMRKELNRMVEADELNTLKGRPWKKILEKLVADGFMNCDFPRLYTVWTRIRMSATIYEKNGDDIVDNEVWDLIQLYADVQKGVSNKGALAKENKRTSDGGRKGGDEDVGDRKESEQQPKKLQRLNPPSELNPQMSENTYVSYEDIEKGAVTSTTQTEEKAKEENKATRSARGQRRLSDREQFEILELIEREFDGMLADGGHINKSISDILHSIKSKNYTSSTLIYTWMKLNREASGNRPNPSQLQQKVQELVKTYHKFKVRKKVNVFGGDAGQDEAGNKTKLTPKQENSTVKKRGRIPFSDEDKLALVSVMKSFGSEVFSKMEGPTHKEFWGRVAAKFKWQRSAESLSRKWNEMLRSAKLTWAQEDRAARVGDKEIIEFMTAVIRDKEKVKGESEMDLSANSDEMAEESFESEEGVRQGEASKQDLREDEDLNNEGLTEGQGLKNDEDLMHCADSTEGRGLRNNEDLMHCADSTEGEGLRNNEDITHSENSTNNEDLKNDEDSTNDEDLKNDEDSTNDEDLTNDEVLTNEEDLSNSKDSKDLKSEDIFANCRKVLRGIGESSNGMVGLSEIKVEGAQGGSDDVVGNYDYVSLEDITKNYSVKGAEKPRPVAVSEVIEISDSDEE